MASGSDGSLRYRLDACPWALAYHAIDGEWFTLHTGQLLHRDFLFDFPPPDLYDDTAGAEGS